jgi:alginate O-acetyltransferase complex protein AlgI
MKARNYTMLILSLLFFSWGSQEYLILIWTSVLVNYGLTRVMDRILVPSVRKTFFIGILTFNLLILFVFKYLGFFFTNINGLVGTQFFSERLAQPLGISFFTFQVLSYVIDVYKQRYEAEYSLPKLALYFLMFPQLASGPIMRWDELKPQMGQRMVRPQLMADGAERFTIGLFKKVFIANTLAALWNIAKTADPAGLSMLFAWVGIIAFTLYIYFDFSGYMDMAIGVANLFGFQLQENFDFPYVAKSISEFWRRWHMTLGRWFKDYIYIPMGGSRQGTAKLILALFTVWFTTGLWHGASWNFIFWGLYFGLLIFLERFVLKPILEKIPGFLANAYTLFMVILGWVLFDTTSLGHARAYLGALFGQGAGLWDNQGIYYLYTYLPILILGIILSRPAIFLRFKQMKLQMNKSRRRFFLIGLLGLFIVSIAYILNQSFSPSMYIGF